MTQVTSSAESKAWWVCPICRNGAGANFAACGYCGRERGHRLRNIVAFLWAVMHRGR